MKYTIFSDFVFFLVEVFVTHDLSKDCRKSENLWNQWNEISMKICVFTVSGCDKFCNFGNFPGKYAFQTAGGFERHVFFKNCKTSFAQIWNIAKKKNKIN